MLTNSCAIFISKISVSIPLPTHNPCRTLWRQIISLRRVLMICSTTFHSNSNRPMTQVSVFPLGIRTRIVHPSSLGIPPWWHMNWVFSTRFCRYGLGGGGGGGGRPLCWIRLPYQFLKCSAWRCVCPPALWSQVCRTCAFNTPSKGTPSLTLKGLTWVCTSLPGGSWILLSVHHGIIPCDIGYVRPWGVWCPHRRMAVPPFGDRVRPYKVRVPHQKFQAWANLLRNLLRLPPGVH